MHPSNSSAVTSLEAYGETGSRKAVKGVFESKKSPGVVTRPAMGFRNRAALPMRSRPIRAVPNGRRTRIQLKPYNVAEYPPIAPHNALTDPEAPSVHENSCGPFSSRPS